MRSPVLVSRRVIHLQYIQKAKDQLKLNYMCHNVGLLCSGVCLGVCVVARETRGAPAEQGIGQ